MSQHILNGLLQKLPNLLEDRKIFLFVVDGLGIEKLNLKGFKTKTYETVFPSSTPTFFYTFHSLLPPKEHGFLEWYMRFNETVVTIPPWKTIDGKTLKLGEDVKKKDVFPFKSLSERLHKKGFYSVYYTPYPNSTFTKATGRKAELVKINFLSEVFPLKDADFTFIYWPSVDAILHERYRDEALESEKKFIELFVQMLKKHMPKGSTLFVFGDHGLTKCEKRILLPTVSGIQPVGGARIAFYKNLEREIVEREIKKKKIPAKVMELNELKGFEGKVSKRCYKNFGEIVVLAERGFGFKYPFEVRVGKKKWDIGCHGGLEKEESYVKVWRYDK